MSRPFSRLSILREGEWERTDCPVMIIASEGGITLTAWETSEQWMVELPSKEEALRLADELSRVASQMS